MGEVTVKNTQTAFQVYQTMQYKGMFNDIPDVDQNELQRSTIFVNTNSRVGETNPFWRSQLANHTDATTSLNGTEYRWDARPWDAGVYWDINDTNTNPSRFTFADYKGEGMMNYAVLPGIPSFGGNDKTEVTNRAIAKFLARAQSVLSSVEAGQDFGEYKSTLQSIRRPLSSARDKVTQYLLRLGKAKRKYMRNPASLKKVIADTYLELSFGIIPLSNDIADVIADLGRYRFDVQPVSATAKLDSNGSLVTVTAGIPASLSVLKPSQYRKSYDTYSVKYYAEIRTGANVDTGQLSWAQSLRMLPEDFVPTAWDLLPWSWMID